MTQKEARKIMLWKVIERYRTAGGREEHHAYKEALDNYIDDMLDVSEMDEVAHRFAHPLALELECVLADRPGYYDRAMQLIGEYRSAMNAIHEQHSPTHMGENRCCITPETSGARSASALGDLLASTGTNAGTT